MKVYAFSTNKVIDLSVKGKTTNLQSIIQENTFMTWHSWKYYTPALRLCADTSAVFEWEFAQAALKPLPVS